MMDEGYSKFQLEWTKQAIHYPEALAALNAVRSRCVQRGWMGMYPDGVGFGNISIRVAEGFLISGTQTGHLQELSAAQVALVTHVDPVKNTCQCTGLIQASSESMTHWALYATQPGIRAVIHIHHTGCWTHWKHRLPTTPATVAYGTPAMAEAIAHCAQEQTVPVIIMAGHTDGILAYGSSLVEAERVLWECMPENVK